MLSPEKNFKPLSDKELETTYLAEIRALDRVTKLPGFMRLLDYFQDYQAFLNTRMRPPSPIESILATPRGGRIIEIANAPEEISQLFGTAHLAACSVLLEGTQINLGKLRSSNLIAEMKQLLAQTLQTDPSQSYRLMPKLVAMDAVRTFQLLRIAGLLTRPSKEMFQLGLGAAGGTKDIYSVHTEPAIYSFPGAEGQIIGFGYTEGHAADTVISDLDPRHTVIYEKFAQDKNLPVTGYISDTFELLETLQTKNTHKRNLITMLRIEPAMIPDCAGLLRRLSPIIDEDCDFILSIGAGDSPDAYELRIEVVADMFEKLERVGLKPVLFRLHLGGNVMQQASSLQFGNAATASYEILYCKISRKKLEKAFSD